MKTLVLFCSLIMFASGIAHAQEEIFALKLKKDKVPAKVIAAIEKEFPDAKITDYTAVPVEVVGEELIINASKNSQDYDSYEVHIVGNDFTGSAIYDKDGTLLYSNEVLKNTALPYAIRYALGKNFPGWMLEGDRKVITTYRNGNQKSYYHVKLMKGKETTHATFDAHGNMMNKRKEVS